MSENETIRWSEDGDGVVVLSLDDPSQSVNTTNAAFISSLSRVVDRLERERDRIRGVLITSAKPTFFTGGDLNDLIGLGPQDASRAEAIVVPVKRALRRIETLGRPVVAAIGGSALGGGLEIALAAHHRIAVEDPAVRLGLPEVGLGLLPVAGGVARSVRMLGLLPALTGLLLEGRRLSPGQAAELGVVDRLVGSDGELAAAATAWIAENPEPVQPWDRKGYRIPGGDPSDPRLSTILAALPARLRKQLAGAPIPAPKAILAAAVEGAQVDFEAAQEIETRYFVSLATGQVAKNMIQAFFQTRRAGPARRAAPQAQPIGRAAIAGAGMMGAAIAYVCAEAGIDVALLDVDLASAERGRRYAERLLGKAVERGRAPADAEQVLARITPSADPESAAGAELLIEAVFEDEALKREVLARIEPHLSATALLATNTSSLPIGSLAESVSRPQDFIGLHFFSPVDRMPLLEIVKGRRTSEQAVARALALAVRLGKTPILVNDSRGFFTSRVIAMFIEEGIAMLAEGMPAPSIEQAAGQAGYPAPVLQLADELSLALLRDIREAARAAVQAQGSSWRAHPAEAVVDRMLELGRGGRAVGAGFYDYEDGRRARLWPGLAQTFGSANASAPLTDLSERMLFIEAIEAVKCLQEGVVESVADANVGSILGIGFPRWTGGVLQLADGYEGGLAGFARRARELAEAYGARFEPPAYLVERAESGVALAE